MSVRNIKEGWENLIKKRMGSLRNDEIRSMAAERSEICIVCEHFKGTFLEKFPNNPFRFKCKKCCCLFPAIVYAPQKKCPVGKW